LRDATSKLVLVGNDLTSPTLLLVYRIWKVSKLFFEPTAANLQTLEHTEVYRRHERNALEALNLLAGQLEASGNYEMALDCEESMTALRNGDLAVASSLLGRVAGWRGEEFGQGSFGDGPSPIQCGHEPSPIRARDLVISHLAGLQEHLFGEPPEGGTPNAESEPPEGGTPNSESQDWA
jgi:hypothetical protein